MTSLAALMVWWWRKIQAGGWETTFGSAKKYLPIVMTLALLGFAYVVATAISVYPALSFWGSDQHQDGLVTFFGQIVLFLSVVTALRNTEQVNRLITSILVASVPVSIYALMQRYNLDPAVTGMTEGRTPSTLGQPIYLGAYLAIVLPLNAGRLLTLVPLRSRTSFFYFALFLLDLAGFFCAQSRGPFVALAAAAGIFFIGASVHGRKKRLLIGGLVFALLAFVFLSLLNLGGTNSSKGLLSNVEQSRLGKIIPLHGESDIFRHAMWEQAPKLMLSSTPLPYPDGTTDRFHSFRLLFGYGPETLPNVLPHQYSWPGTEPDLDNPFHNLVWDTWSTIGLVGLFAFLLFFVLLFSVGFKNLGLKPGIYFYLAVMACGAAGAVILGLWLGWGYAGLGGVAGLIAGLALYWLEAGLVGKGESLEALSEKTVLQISLLAAMAGHLIEMSFAYATPATATLFWIYAAVLLFLGHGLKTESATEGKHDKRGAAKLTPGAITQKRQRLWSALAGGLILVTLLSDFIFIYPISELSITGVLATTLTETRFQEPSLLIWLLFLPTAIMVSFAFAAEPFLKTKPKRLGASFWFILLLSGALAGVYALLRAAIISGIGPIRLEAGTDYSAVGQGDGYQALYLVFVVAIVTAVGLGGFLLAPPVESKRHSPEELWVMAGAQGMALIVGWFLCINPVRANMMARWALELRKYECAPQSVEVLHHAVSLAPGSAEYHRELSEASMFMAGKELTTDAFNQAMAKAETELIEVKKLTSGLDLASYELGVLYLEWAGTAAQPEQQKELAQKARGAFAQALIYLPGYEVAWTDRAAADLLYLNDPADGEMSRKKAAELWERPVLTPLDWGNFYRDRATAVSDVALKRFYAAHALDFYDTGIREVADSLFVALCRIGKSSVDLALGDPASALTEYQEAIKTNPRADTWETELILSRIYAQLGNQDQAQQALEKATTMAPPDEKNYLRNMAASVKQDGP
ncbi:MAG: O-antigen ligase family protein [Methylacidiphilales bacterium]|nr:O-antigen ligase family protein [Candidatus Methylacidiphilales bacterium]